MAKRKYIPKYKPTPIPDPSSFIGWMDGYCSTFTDLPDGAWQVACEGAVEHYNHEHGTKIDTYDGWMYWVENSTNHVVL